MQGTGAHSVRVCVRERGRTCVRVKEREGGAGIERQRGWRGPTLRQETQSSFSPQILSPQYGQSLLHHRASNEVQILSPQKPGQSSPQVAGVSPRWLSQ